MADLFSSRAEEEAFQAMMRSGKMDTWVTFGDTRWVQAPTGTGERPKFAVSIDEKAKRADRSADGLLGALSGMPAAGPRLNAETMKGLQAGDEKVADKADNEFMKAYNESWAFGEQMRRTQEGGAASGGGSMADIDDGPRLKQQPSLQDTAATPEAIASAARIRCSLPECDLVVRPSVAVREACRNCNPFIPFCSEECRLAHYKTAHPSKLGF